MRSTGTRGPPVLSVLGRPTRVNVTGGRWKAKHDIVPRNHRFINRNDLMPALRRFLRAAEPFQDNQHGLAVAN